jgi:hypothetical protein
MTPLVQRFGYPPLRTDEECRAWIAQFPDDTPVYLATDNGETQAQVLAAFSEGRVHVGARISGGARQDMNDHHRNGTLADAAVDLFVCAGAEQFLGAGFGSFSATIEILRGLR